MAVKGWDAAADEARFRADVATGDKWVRKVATRLSGLGLWQVTVPDVRIRTQFDDRRAFRDDGDLFLNGHRIEVRSLAQRFTGPGDYPHPAIQVELSKVLPHKTGVVAYLFVSRPTGAMVGLYGCDLRGLGEQAAVWNARRGVARDWRVADRAKLKSWNQVVNYLAEQCAKGD